MRQKLEMAISQACDRLSVPNAWIDLESITGRSEAVFFDPFDSFEQLMARRSTFLSDEGEEGSERMQQIARDAYTSTESILYVISPQRSHVGKEFTAGDPEFWKRGLKTPHSKPAAKNSEGKPVEAKKN